AQLVLGQGVCPESSESVTDAGSRGLERVRLQGSGACGTDFKSVLRPRPYTAAESALVKQIAQSGDTILLPCRRFSRWIKKNGLYPRGPRPFVIVDPVVAHQQDLFRLQARPTAHFPIKRRCRFAPANLGANHQMLYRPQRRQAGDDPTQALVEVRGKTHRQAALSQLLQYNGCLFIAVPSVGPGEVSEQLLETFLRIGDVGEHFANDRAPARDLA